LDNSVVRKADPPGQRRSFLVMVHLVYPAEVAVKQVICFLCFFA